MALDSVELPRLPSKNMSRGSASSYDTTFLPTPRSAGGYEMQNDEDNSMTSQNGEFYNEVESFLNRPSPSLARIAKASKSTDNLLPMLKAERTKLRVEKPDVRINHQPNDKRNSKKQIDLSLVQQAFAYADELRSQQLQDNDTHDDVQEVIQRQIAKHTTATKPSNEKIRATKPKAAKPPQKQLKSKTSAIYGASEKQAAKVKAGPEWDKCSKENSSGPQHSSMDPQLVQQLLSNFQNATSLNELRQELAASQASLKESRQVLQGAAKTFFMRSGSGVVG